jgi:hypothetical protein
MDSDEAAADAAEAAGYDSGSEEGGGAQEMGLGSEGGSEDSGDEAGPDLQVDEVER